MDMRTTSISSELRIWLTQLLCLLMLVQGPPLEAAERRLEVQLAGIPIQVVRSYDSRRKDKIGDFGYGWTLEVKQGAYRTNGPLGRSWEIGEGPEVAEGYVIYLPCKTPQELRGHTARVRLSDQELYRFRPRLYDFAPSLADYAKRLFK